MDHASSCGVFRQRVQVGFEYPVCFTHGVFKPENRSLVDCAARLEPTRRHRIYAVIDEGVARAWPSLVGGDTASALRGDASGDIARYCAAHSAQLQLIAPPRVVPGGERSKQSPELIAELHAELQRHGVDRQSFVLGIGGGAVLDAVGYAAATTHRGVRLIRVPTTVLGQNDSGVGVKNGINAFGSKNFLGTFAPPFAVINDVELLRTLEPRDMRAGMAEAVKVALIRDPAFFAWLEQHVAQLAAFELDSVARLVRVAAEIHLRHIAGAGDPFEQGSARPLDFGHWAAHKLESLSDHELRHGEAVAIGMALDSCYSARTGLLEMAALERICALLEGLGFQLWHDALGWLGPGECPRVLDGLREFREHLGGELTVTLLSGIGRGQEVHEIDASEVCRALGWLEQRARARQAAAARL